MSNIKILKMMSGEEVIGDITSKDDINLKKKNTKTNTKISPIENGIQPKISLKNAEIQV